MLATHAPSLSLHSAPPTARSSLLSSSRSAFADSTNVNSRLNVGYQRSSVYPTSSVRTGCDWSGFESSTTSTSASCQPRPHHLPSVPSLFTVPYKAPPTVSISLSAACSQNISEAQFCGTRVQGLEPDLPDVKNVVPFPVTPSNGDMDADMLDGTRAPCSDGHLPSTGQAPRKRRSAHFSVSSSQGGVVTDAKQKRAKKSRRQVTELWWLGVIHRSISRAIEDRRSVEQPDAFDRLLARPSDLDAMDQMLVERIQKRLAENGCVEGRALPNPLPRISSPSISVPSLILLAPRRQTPPPINSGPFTLSSASNPRGDTASSGIATCPLVFKAPPCAPLPITSHSSIPSSRSTSRRRHVHFEIPQGPHLAIPRRSPSPPARTGTVPTSAQVLTMPQLVATLTLACHERSRLRSRGRTYKATECRSNASHSPLSESCQTSEYSNDDGHRKEGMHQSFTPRAKLSSAPERKSPLSRVGYAES